MDPSNLVEPDLAAGMPVNIVRVDDETARFALESLRRMLEVK